VVLQRQHHVLPLCGVRDGIAILKVAE